MSPLPQSPQAERRRVGVKAESDKEHMIIIE